MNEYEDLRALEKRVEKLEADVNVLIDKTMGKNSHEVKIIELEQWFKLHDDGSMSHKAFEKEILTIVKKNEKLEQKIDHGFEVIRDFNNIQKKKTLKIEAVLKNIPNLIEWIINNFKHVADFNKIAGVKHQIFFQKLDGEPSNVLDNALDKLDVLYPLGKEEQDDNSYYMSPAEKDVFDALENASIQDQEEFLKTIENKPLSHKLAEIYYEQGKKDQKEAEPLKEIEIEFLKKYGWYQQIKKEQEQKDITEFIAFLRKFNEEPGYYEIDQEIKRLEAKLK